MLKNMYLSIAQSVAQRLGCSDMRLIDADALLKELEPYGLTKGCTIGRHSGMTEMLMDIVEKQPTVDAVEVVRCKDCKYYGSGVCWNESFTGYCSYGKRRDGD